MVSVLGMDYIHTKFQLSRSIPSMVFTTLVPIFWEFPFLKNSYLRIPYRYQKIPPFRPGVICREPSKKLACLRTLWFSGNRAHKFKSVIGNYAQHIRNSGMKLPVKIQILVTNLKLLSYILYVPCNSRNMKLKILFATEE